MNTRHSFLLVFTIGLLGQAGIAYASLFVQGTVSFENQTYSTSRWGSVTSLPARSATVKILRASDNAELAGTYTDSAGHYQVTVGGLNSGDSYKVKVLAETAAATVGPNGSSIYACIWASS